MFLGLIDVQDTVAGRKARNTGHKALRARAVSGLSDLVGWDNAHGVHYMGVPDMAVGPLYYSLYDAVCVLLAAEFPDAGKSLKDTNKTPLSEAEVEELVRLLMEADQATVWSCITAHLKAGKSIASLGEAIQIGAAELILRITVPREFTNGQHPFDYCNTGNYWLRRSDSPYKPRILYLMANFVNDAALTFKLQNPPAEPQYDSSRRPPEALLGELDEAILAFDIPRTTAIAQAYLRSRGDIARYFATVALSACKFQDDPHNQKITHSSFEEYAHNSTHLKDRLLVASARLLAGWTKMPGERECHARFMRDWIRH
jgi:hypothetical protein